MRSWEAAPARLLVDDRVAIVCSEPHLAHSAGSRYNDGSLLPQTLQPLPQGKTKQFERPFVIGGFPPIAQLVKNP